MTSTPTRNPPQMQRFFCHDCQAQFTTAQPAAAATADQQQPLVCTECGSEFVEIVEDQALLSPTPNAVQDPFQNLFQQLLMPQVQAPVSGQQQQPLRAVTFQSRRGNGNGFAFSMQMNTQHFPGQPAGEQHQQQQQQQPPLIDFQQLFGELFGNMGNMGDYAFGAQGLDDIITRLMQQHQQQGGHQHQGLTQEQIDLLRRTQFVKRDGIDDECAICQDEYTAESELLHLPSCRHHFDTSCITAWLRISATCPVCRKDVTVDITGQSSSSGVAQPDDLSSEPPE